MAIVMRQQMLTEVSAALADVSEVLEVFSMTGPTNLLVRVVDPMRMIPTASQHAFW
jgi:DNA-binding Lrp family transcriptional regulator